MMADMTKPTVPTEDVSCWISSKRAGEDDLSNWLRALVTYVRDTKTDKLDLKNKGLRHEEVESVLRFLSDSQVSELDLSYNCLTDGMTHLSPLLAKTNLKKLNVSQCRLTKDDVLCLAEVLKDSQICDLVSHCWGVQFSPDEARKYISKLINFKIAAPSFDFFGLFPLKTASLVQDSLNISLTRLDLGGHHLRSGDFIFLFANLGRSSVTDLNLQDTKISLEALKALSRRLVETKIEKLNLGRNNLRIEELDVLVGGLVNSKVVDLDLALNPFPTLFPLFNSLGETRVRTLNLGYNECLEYKIVALIAGLLTQSEPKFFLFYPDSLRCSVLASLDLSHCGITDKAGEGLMDGLRYSSVTKLNISNNFVGLLTVEKFAVNVKDINLIELDISHNDVPCDGLFILSACLKESKLVRIHVSSICENARNHGIEAVHLLSFLKQTEGSSVLGIRMNGYADVWCCPPDGELEMLANTTFRVLHLSHSNIKYGVAGLVRFFKCTNITNLNLASNKITDDGAAALAECLKETQIRRLNLNNNSITSEGARALALEFKDSALLYLHLSKNEISDDGIEFLAEQAKDTFISELDVTHNTGKRILLVDEVLWRNKLSVHRLVSFFERITSQTNSDEFCFDQNSEDSNIRAFLDECLKFYKTVVDKPQAIGALFEENNVAFSREKICRLLFEEFPRQFSAFVACRIETDAMEQVRILEKADELGLTGVVESLLLHRPVYTLDEEHGILHPPVYRLLLKYKQPVCNLAIEPRGVIKLIEYFTEHTDIEGAQDVVNLLRDANIS